MTANLSDLILRARAALHDSPGLVYDSATLEEAVRQALAVYNLAASSLPASPSPASLSGLDGALETTLPALYESLLVSGAAAYAAQARAAEQASRAALDSDSTSLRAWADERLKEFQHLLALVFPLSGQSAEVAAQEAANAARAEAEAQRLNQLRTSVDVPWRTWIDAEE